MRDEPSPHEAVESKLFKLVYDLTAYRKEFANDKFTFSCLKNTLLLLQGFVADVEEMTPPMSKA